MFAGQIGLDHPSGRAIRPVLVPGGSATHGLAPRHPPRQLLLMVLDEVNHGLLLVNESAEVRYANRVASRDCVAGQALHYDGQRLCIANPEDRSALLRAIDAAKHGRRAMLTLRTASASMSVGIVPVSPSPDDGDAVALLVLGRQVNFDPLGLQFFAQMHQLTAAERAVLEGLCEGLCAGEVAKRGGVALSTVRTQIGSIRQKTRARSLNHVVQMVHSLPPVVPVWSQLERREQSVA